MKRIHMALMLGTAVILGGLPAAGQNKGAAAVTVYKDPSCGCCALWVKHLEQHGFVTKVIETADVNDIKTKNLVPRQARSCHTALVNGYAIEGHVPAADIQRLLKERPAVAGLAVPGMPIGSP